ncbi:O1019 protein, partial [Oxylabes madagascariensis]|nr:O1019 protein [Oxylabes madagascariensis]
MAGENETFTSEFILLGFTTQADPQVMFLVLFLALYMVTLLGNLGVIVLIQIDPRLHTPMYFFPSHLSLLDICYFSTIIPWSLRDLLVDKKVISFARWITQLFSFATWATTECHVLATMGYDRHVAICRLLLYSMLMSQRICGGMLAGAYLAAVLSSTPHTVSIFHTPFCRSRTIEHFFCDGPPLLALSCSDTCASRAVVPAVVGFNVLSTTAFILVSFSSILTAVLQIRSVAGRNKALSTCTSHLASVALHHGSSLRRDLCHSILRDLCPVCSHSPQQDKFISLVYSVTIPMLRPFVHSLRSMDVRSTMRKARSRILAAW